jgi:hypothetical protein
MKLLQTLLIFTVLLSTLCFIEARKKKPSSEILSGIGFGSGSSSSSSSSRLTSKPDLNLLGQPNANFIQEANNNPDLLITTIYYQFNEFHATVIILMEDHRYLLLDKNIDGIRARFKEFGEIDVTGLQSYQPQLMANLKNILQAYNDENKINYNFTYKNCIHFAENMIKKLTGRSSLKKRRSVR